VDREPRCEDQIALVPSGSGTVVGVCDLIDCIGPLTQSEFRKNASKAGLQKHEAQLGRYRTTYAWVLEEPKRLDSPVPYKHPSGAVIWVNLDRSVERKILKQLHSPPPHRRAASLSERGLFAIGEIVSMEYDDLHPERYEPGIFIGIVVRREGNRMKVVYAYETGETDFAWLTRHDEKVPNRWIDNTYAAIVQLEEASVSQRQAFQRWVPANRRKKLLEGERAPS